MSEHDKKIVRSYISDSQIAEEIINNCELGYLVEWPRYMDWPDEYLVVCTHDGKRGVYDNNGKIIVPCKYSKINPIGDNGRTEFIQGGIFKREQKFSYGNINDGYSNDCDLEYVEEKDNFKVFKKESTYYIYLYGILVFQNDKVEQIGDITEGFICARKGSLWGIVDFNSNIIIPFSYEGISGFKTGVAIIKKNNLYGAINIKNEMILTPIYDSLYVEECHFRARLKDKWGIIDLSGLHVIPFSYKKLFEISEGLIGAVQNDKIGFLDLTNKVVIPFKYYYEEYSSAVFKNGVSCVSLKNENGELFWGYINHADYPVTEFNFDFQKDMKYQAVENIISERTNYGRCDYKMWVLCTGDQVKLDEDFTEDPIDDDYCSESSGNVDIFGSYSDNEFDKMDAYEGDYDALWNTD